MDQSEIAAVEVVIKFKDGTQFRKLIAVPEVDDIRAIFRDQGVFVRGRNIETGIEDVCSTGDYEIALAARYKNKKAAQTFDEWSKKHHNLKPET